MAEARIQQEKTRKCTCHYEEGRRALPLKTVIIKPTVVKFKMIPTHSKLGRSE
jgi:hypothetical protein